MDPLEITRNVLTASLAFVKKVDAGAHTIIAGLEAAIAELGEDTMKGASSGPVSELVGDCRAAAA